MVQETWNLLFVMLGLGFMIGNRFGNNDAGNICRSPSAEAVFRYLVEQKGLASDFVIDSAGTINYHEVFSSLVFFFFPVSKSLWVAAAGATL
jgi:hypothetical protein